MNDGPLDEPVPGAGDDARTGPAPLTLTGSDVEPISSGRTVGDTDLVVVVLAGGLSRRFGTDKLVAPLGGVGLLERVIEGLPPRARVVLVGPPRDVGRPAEFVRERPAHGGPVAAVKAGLQAAMRGSGSGAVVAVLPGDTPGAGGALLPLLDALRPEVHIAVGVDADGIDQPLHLVLDRTGVQAWLKAAGDVAGRAAYAVLTDLTVPMVRVTLTPDQVRDVDTKADLTALAADLAR